MGLRRPSSSSSTLFKYLLLRNNLASQSRISYRASMGWGNQKAVDLESWYASSGARVLPSLLKWPWVDLDLFYGKSNLVPYAFVWEKGKTMDFSETIVVCDLKLATYDWSDKTFLLTSKRCPLAAVCPLPRGHIHVLNHEKKMYKIRLQRDFFETCNKWVKWYDLSVDIKILSPGCCLPQPRGYIHVLNHEKKCIKSDFKKVKR